MHLDASRLVGIERGDVVDDQRDLVIPGRDVLEFARLGQRPPTNDEDLTVELESDRVGVTLTASARPVASRASRCDCR